MKTRSTRIKSAGKVKTNNAAAGLFLFLGIAAAVAVPYIFYLLFLDFQLTNQTDIIPYITHIIYMIVAIALSIVFFNLFMRFKGIAQPRYEEV